MCGVLPSGTLKKPPQRGEVHDKPGQGGWYSHAETPGVPFRAFQEGGEVLMSRQRKDTPKPPQRRWKPTEIAGLFLALGGFLSGLAAVIQALKP